MTTTVSFYIANLLKEKDEQFDVISTLDHPSIAEVVMWLLEKHKIWIVVSNCIYDGKSGWCFDIHRIPTGILYLWKRGDVIFDSPKEAYEAGIECYLTKLIKEEKK